MTAGRLVFEAVGRAAAGATTATFAVPGGIGACRTRL